MRSLLLILLTLATFGCGSEPVEEPTDFGVAHADEFLNDASWRRERLEASLWKPELPYARKRLAGYALGDRGWDLLPTIRTEVTTIGAKPRTFELLSHDEIPQTREDWLELGERVFWFMPMRRDTYLEWIADNPEQWDDLGFQRDEDGNLRGVVRFTDARGNSRVGATCGLCHGDEGLAGQATRDLDLGKGRDKFSVTVYGQETDYDSWGAGRVDVTDDQVVDALAIPDLWGVRHQQYMNHSGAIRLDTPAALAIRFDTQYVVGHSLEARPDRRIPWALMMFVYDLEPPQPESAVAEDGERLFSQRCASCHVPDLGYSGGLVSADVLSSDPQAANSIMRGTGGYKASSLLNIAAGAPYLHDASLSSLDELLRVHPTASDLTEVERDQLIEFLQTL